MKLIQQYAGPVLLLLIMAMLVAAIALYQQEYYDIVFFPRDHASGEENPRQEETSERAGSLSEMGLAQRGTEWSTWLWIEGHTLSSGRHARMRHVSLLFNRDKGSSLRNHHLQGLPA